MTEFELKLEIPRTRVAGVEKALSALRPATERLRAIYFDTPEQLLRREGLVLRLRSENGSWVQTLKGDSGRALERLEHEVPLGRLRRAPRPEAARHAGSPAGERLSRVLGQGFDDGAWEPLFETDVRRAKAHALEGASTIEIALDRGHVRAGGRTEPLCEIEFELKDGEPRAAVELARRWSRDHGLWLSTISKAQKGAQLASREGGFGPAAGAGEAHFGRRASLRRISGEALAVSLDQVIRNASELAAGSADEEHVHQLRVGIRRARTAWRELAGEPPGREEAALVHAFRELGRRRDVTHVLGVVAPKLRAAGGPVPDEPGRGRGPAPSRIVRAAAFQDAVLSLLSLACGMRADDGPGRGAQRDITARLAKLRAKALRDGRDFERLDATRQHRVRKRLKRLRYLAEFAAPLYDRGAVAKYLARLKQSQDALGEYNDAMAALAHYRELAARDAQALFAVGWLEADRVRAAHECGRRLRRLAKADPFWT